MVRILLWIVALVAISWLAVTALYAMLWVAALVDILIKTWR